VAQEAAAVLAAAALWPFGAIANRRLAEVACAEEDLACAEVACAEEGLACAEVACAEDLACAEVACAEEAACAEVACAWLEALA